MLPQPGGYLYNTKGSKDVSRCEMRRAGTVHAKALHRPPATSYQSDLRSVNFGSQTWVTSGSERSRKEILYIGEEERIPLSLSWPSLPCIECSNPLEKQFEKSTVDLASCQLVSLHSICPTRSPHQAVDASSSSRSLPSYSLS